MGEFCYGSFTRPLDFVIGNEFPHAVIIRHNPWPLKHGQPHSVLESAFPLTCQDMYRFELRLLDVWEMTIPDLKELCDPEPFSLPIDAHTILNHQDGMLYLNISGDDEGVHDLFEVRDGSELIEIENADTDRLISIPVGSNLREILKAAQEIL